ncbi:MAG: DUF4234 domain-containing protein [Oscillospiraceae bacterium]|jgi:hypothetical protein|nr:DUF4234 domain-containing protein [Oscillospiraceae bacterium]
MDDYNNSFGSDYVPPEAPQPPPYYGQGAPPPSPGYITSKSIGLAIFLSIITCGIYSVYWLYTICADLSRAVSPYDGIPVWADVLLCVFVPFYYIYVAYKWAKQIALIDARFNRPAEDRVPLYIILSVVGLGIVVYALAQSELNKIAEGRAY